jgi:hypothetical protein
MKRSCPGDEDCRVPGVVEQHDFRRSSMPTATSGTDVTLATSTPVRGPTATGSVVFDPATSAAGASVRTADPSPCSNAAVLHCPTRADHHAMAGTALDDMSLVALWEWLAHKDAVAGWNARQAATQLSCYQGDKMRDAIMRDAIDGEKTALAAMIGATDAAAAGVKLAAVALDAELGRGRAEREYDDAVLDMTIEHEKKVSDGLEAERRAVAKRLDQIRTQCTSSSLRLVSLRKRQAKGLAAGHGAPPPAAARLAELTAQGASLETERWTARLCHAFVAGLGQEAAICGSLQLHQSETRLGAMVRSTATAIRDVVCRSGVLVEKLGSGRAALDDALTMSPLTDGGRSHTDDPISSAAVASTPQFPNTEGGGNTSPGAAPGAVAQSQASSTWSAPTRRDYDVLQCANAALSRMVHIGELAEAQLNGADELLDRLQQSGVECARDGAVLRARDDTHELYGAIAALVKQTADDRLDKAYVGASLTTPRLRGVASANEELMTMSAGGDVMNSRGSLSAAGMSFGGSTMPNSTGSMGTPCTKTRKGLPKRPTKAKAAAGGGSVAGAPGASLTSRFSSTASLDEQLLLATTSAGGSAGVGGQQAGGAQPAFIAQFWEAFGPPRKHATPA